MKLIRQCSTYVQARSILKKMVATSSTDDRTMHATPARAHSMSTRSVLLIIYLRVRTSSKSLEFRICSSFFVCVKRLKSIVHAQQPSDRFLHCLSFCLWLWICQVWLATLYERAASSNSERQARVWCWVQQRMDRSSDDAWPSSSWSSISSLCCLAAVCVMSCRWKQTRPMLSPYILVTECMCLVS